MKAVIKVHGKKGNTVRKERQSEIKEKRNEMGRNRNEEREKEQRIGKQSRRKKEEACRYQKTGPSAYSCKAPALHQFQGVGLSSCLHYCT
jgi:hypothetical protein